MGSRRQISFLADLVIRGRFISFFMDASVLILDSSLLLRMLLLWRVAGANTDQFRPLVSKSTYSKEYRSSTGISVPSGLRPSLVRVRDSFKHVLVK